MSLRCNSIAGIPQHTSPAASGNAILGKHESHGHMEGGTPGVISTHLLIGGHVIGDRRVPAWLGSDTEGSF